MHWRNSQAFKLSGLVNLDVRRAGCERVQAADEIARGGDCEMRCQRRSIGPPLGENESVRILAIDVNCV
jgi:hypothetical protein